MSGRMCFIYAMRGCGGRLCRICRNALHRYTLLRYSADRFGESDLSAAPKRYRLCGYISASGSVKDAGRLEIEGRRDKKSVSSRLLTVAAYSGKKIMCGDRIIADGCRYRVTEVIDRGCLMARLVPEENA